MKLFYCFFNNRSYENNKAQLRVSLNLKQWWKKFVIVNHNGKKVERISTDACIFLKLFAAVSYLIWWKCVKFRMCDLIGLTTEAFFSAVN